MSPSSRSRSGFFRVVSSEILRQVLARSLMMSQSPLYYFDVCFELGRGDELGNYRGMESRHEHY